MIGTNYSLATTQRVLSFRTLIVYMFFSSIHVFYLFKLVYFYKLDKFKWMQLNGTTIKCVVLIQTVLMKQLELFIHRIFYWIRFKSTKLILNLKTHYSLNVVQLIFFCRSCSKIDEPFDVFWLLYFIKFDSTHCSTLMDQLIFK